MGKKDKSNKKFATSIKRSFRKLKYLDKTQSSYFIVTCFIAVFFVFTGITYSYFTFSKSLHAATITIAKLNYILESTTSGYKNQKITVPAGETIFVDFSLKSLNKERTKYALNYDTDSNDIKVYYSETLKKNTSGIIGPEGSIIDMRIVIENVGEKDSEVRFDVDGGYIQNTLSPSNIENGYFEQDLTIRTHIYDENFESAVQVFNFPDKENYSFYKVDCSNGVTGKFDTETWVLTRSDAAQKTSCDVYFKTAVEEKEVFYRIDGNNETTKYTKTKPDNNGLYRYVSTTCTNVENYTFDENTFDFNINDYHKNALCVLNFKTDITLESADRYTVFFDATGGKTKTSSKVILKGGKFGILPKPIYENHLFLGWFTDAISGEEVTSESIVTASSDVKLYAHWSEASGVDVTLAALNGTLNTDVFSAADDYGTSYYYPSTSTNNYIKYADLYWRIIRINGDGSLRIIYDGTKIHDNNDDANDRVLNNVSWNESNSNDNKYVGYMYGYDNGIASTNVKEATTNSTSSNVKVFLENWYREKIVSRGFQNNVADSIFCNDRTAEENTGFGTIPTAYGARTRFVNADGTLKSNLEPVLSCTYKEDAMTVRESNLGSASLDYPIGLITIDEIALIDGWNEYSYLNRGKAFWTMSPSHFSDSAHMFVYSKDVLDSKVTDKNYVVPVINLSAEYAFLIEGEGTKTNPYFVK